MQPMPQFLFQPASMPNEKEFKPIPVKINQNIIELEVVYHDFKIKLFILL